MRVFVRESNSRGGAEAMDAAEVRLYMDDREDRPKYSITVHPSGGLLIRFVADDGPTGMAVHPMGHNELLIRPADI